jgi:hypothetical protein
MLPFEASIWRVEFDFRASIILIVPLLGMSLSVASENEKKHKVVTVDIKMRERRVYFESFS